MARRAKIEAMPTIADVVIRPMQADDYDFVVTLSSDVFGAYTWDPVASTLGMLDEPDAAAAVAELDREPLGFVIVQFERFKRDMGPWKRPVLAHLDAIAVRPELFGRGIGRRLLTHAEELARLRGAVSLSLLTARNNTRARTLFASSGFMAVAPILRAYARRQGGIAMLKPLAID
jgi:ribosomal protein S18 acetylase RimI-like enzyme